MSRNFTAAKLLHALAALAFLFQACAHSPRNASSNRATPANSPRPSNAFDEYMRADFAPADGFDFPFGDGAGGGSYTDISTGKHFDGWYVATRFAENYS